MFIATCLDQGPSLPVEHSGRQIIAELLGLGEGSIRTAITKLTDAGARDGAGRAGGPLMYRF